MWGYSQEYWNKLLLVLCLWEKKYKWIVTPKACFLQGWKRHGSYCYFVGTAMKKFDEAKSDCEALGSYLADVSNGLEPPNLSHCWFFTSCALTLRFIHLNGAETNLWTCLHISRVDNAFLVSLVGLRPEKHFWLGLSNQKNIDEFVWTQGSAVKYTHWNTGMPGTEEDKSLLIWNNRNKQLCILQLSPTNNSRLRTGVCCHDDWNLGRTLGSAALHKYIKIHLQTHGCGGGCDCSTTHSDSSQVRRNLESSGNKKLLCQGTTRTATKCCS